MNKNRSRPMLTTGPVGPMLISLTLPMLMGMASIVVFNLVDAFFIGQLGKEELAAVSFTFPVVMVVNSIALGLGVGASAVISRAIGQGQMGTVRRITTDALLLGVLAVLVFVIVGEVTVNPLFTLLGADKTTLPLVRDYMQMWYVGVIFIVIPMVGNNAIRATGDMLTPGLIMVAAAGLNILLDPILIFGFGPIPSLGVFGGALATVIARAICLPLSLWVLIKRENLITFALVPPEEMFHSWTRILHIGIPAAGTHLITPISAGILTRLVSGFGVAAVAGFGVATRIEMLVLMLVMALGSVLVPFTGQNWGSKKMDRVALAAKGSFIFAMIWGAGSAVCFFLWADSMALLFNKDPEVVSTASSYLKIVSISYGFQGILVLATSILNALARPGSSVFLSFLRAMGLYVPLAYLGSELWGIGGVFLAGCIANIISGVLGIAMTAKQIEKF